MPSVIGTVDETVRAWRPTRAVTAIIGLVFAASATLQIAGVPFTSSFRTRSRFDMDVYRLGGQLWHQGISLYADGSMPFTQDGIWLPFTYPPFAALLFTPLGELSLSVTSLGISILTVALLVYVTALSFRVVGIGDRSNQWQLAILVSAITLWFNPFGMTLGYGQINMVLITLIMIDLFVIGRGPSSRSSGLHGALTGIASAIKLTPLVFFGVFLAARQYRAIAVGLATFALAGVIGWIWIPDDSVTYWTHTLFHTGRIGEPAGGINQNLNGSWLRIFGESTTTSILWVLSSLVATALAVAAVFASRPREAFAPGPMTGRMSAMMVACSVAIWGLLVSPTTWAHHWVWCVPAIAVCFVVAARADEARTRRVYATLAMVGIVIFAIGPFQLFGPGEAGWAWWQHPIGDAYPIWGIALLIAFWRLPARTLRRP